MNEHSHNNLLIIHTTKGLRAPQEKPPKTKGRFSSTENRHIPVEVSALVRPCSQEMHYIIAGHLELIRNMAVMVLMNFPIK